MMVEPLVDNAEAKYASQERMRDENKTRVLVEEAMRAVIVWCWGENEWIQSQHWCTWENREMYCFEMKPCSPFMDMGDDKSSTTAVRFVYTTCPAHIYPTSFLRLSSIYGLLFSASAPHLLVRGYSWTISVFTLQFSITIADPQHSEGSPEPM